MGRDRVMLLTGPGVGAIAVLRLVGPGVGEFAHRHCSKPLAVGRCVYCEVRDGVRVIDNAVAVLVDECTLDLNVHGGTWVVASVMELARRAGFEAGEEMDAVDGETLLEREVMAWLPRARTREAIGMLAKQEELWRGWEPSPDEVIAALADRSLWWMLNPPRVAIVGVPNVGKSTLANQLFAQERSITADVPGTTRDWVGEYANLDGLAVMLVDTPGVRETTDAIEREAIARSREVVRGADLIVVVLDATRRGADQEKLLASASIVVVNKIDRGDEWHELKDAVRTVAVSGQGVGELIERVRARFLSTRCGPRWWTERQRLILERGLDDFTSLVDIDRPVRNPCA